MHVINVCGNETLDEKGVVESAHSVTVGLGLIWVPKMQICGRRAFDLVTFQNYYNISSSQKALIIVVKWSHAVRLIFKNQVI